MLPRRFCPPFGSDMKDDFLLIGPEAGALLDVAGTGRTRSRQASVTDSYSDEKT